MPGASDSSRLWEQLLEYVDEGRVIPIVGQDLLRVTFEGRPVLLYRLLAERLARRLDVEDHGLDETGGLNTVACRYLARGGELEDIYSALKVVMPPPESLGTCEPLRKLAAITPFRLFVTTTLDPLLARTIDAVRHGGRPRTEVLAYSPQSVADLRLDQDGDARPTVFHLLGRLSAVPDYAITDEDVLEFVHSLQSDTRRPAVLFDELKRRHLLIIGSSFSGWLARFFIRIAKRERLTQARLKTDIVADRHMRDDPSLVHFLQHFSARTKVFPEGGAEFVDELHERWSERHPGSPFEDRDARAPAPQEGAEMERGAVFLSYASEDRPAVERIQADLERAGIDTWFDRRELEMGDSWQARIRRNIEACSFFLPILSRHTVTRERRYFRTEWRYAETVALQVPPTMKFILPVAIDGTAPTEPTLPDAFRELQWVRLSAGVVTPEFVGELKQLFREYHRGRAGD